MSGLSKKRNHCQVFDILVSRYGLVLSFIVIFTLQNNVPGLSLKHKNYTKNLFMHFTKTLHAKFLIVP